MRCFQRKRITTIFCACVCVDLQANTKTTIFIGINMERANLDLFLLSTRSNGFSTWIGDNCNGNRCKSKMKMSFWDDWPRQIFAQGQNKSKKFVHSVFFLGTLALDTPLLLLASLNIKNCLCLLSKMMHCTWNEQANDCHREMERLRCVRNAVENELIYSNHDSHYNLMQCTYIKF